MRTLTVGVVAHVDAGKTSLTERILHEAGVLDHPGSVDTGDTQTDSLDLERRRGITIRSAVASFEWHDTLVNLLDTPGHSDFVAEVERALAVLDAAVLVVSAVEGVQAQTLVLMRALSAWAPSRPRDATTRHTGRSSSRPRNGPTCARAPGRARCTRSSSGPRSRAAACAPCSTR